MHTWPSRLSPLPAPRFEGSFLAESEGFLFDAVVSAFLQSGSVQSVSNILILLGRGLATDALATARNASCQFLPHALQLRRRDSS
jgi:hypothetical protein